MNCAGESRAKSVKLFDCWVPRGSKLLQHCNLHSLSYRAADRESERESRGNGLLKERNGANVPGRFSQEVEVRIRSEEARSLRQSGAVSQPSRRAI